MNTNSLKVLNSFGLVFLIGMNMLAVLLPLGGKTTGELSALYPNLFVPSGLTFAIWSVIYVLLIIFVVYQWVGKKANSVVDTIGIWFIVNALANGLWLVFWHYEFVIISLFIMMIILGSLIKMYKALNVEYFTNPVITWQARVPLSVYMGWISVATIANTSVVFVAHGVTELGLGADKWASIMIFIATMLGARILYLTKDIFFGLVICWAAYGIYTKRINDTQLVNDVNIEHVSYACIFVMLIGIILTIVQSLIKRK